MSKISHGERVEIAKAIKMAKEFGFPMALEPPGEDGCQLVVVTAPNRPRLVLGTFRPPEVYKTVLISPGHFQGADGGAFENKSYSGDDFKPVDSHWPDIEGNLYYLIDAWLGLLPTTPSL